MMSQAEADQRARQAIDDRNAVNRSMTDRVNGIIADLHGKPQAAGTLAACLSVLPDEKWQTILEGWQERDASAYAAAQTAQGQAMIGAILGMFGMDKDAVAATLPRIVSALAPVEA